MEYKYGNQEYSIHITYVIFLTKIILISYDHLCVSWELNSFGSDQREKSTRKILLQIGPGFKTFSHFYK